MHIAIIIIAIIIILFITTALVFSNKVIHIKIRSAEQVMSIIEEYRSFEKKFYQLSVKENFSVVSDSGYDIKGVILYPKEKTSNCIIFSHGVMMRWESMIPYAKVFCEMGYNCIMYDHRRHGQTGGKNTTYGYYEKHDLKNVIKYAKNRFGNASILGIMGESMGASIMLQYAGMEYKSDPVDFYISDCPYASLELQLKQSFKYKYHVGVFPIFNITRWAIKIRAKFDIMDVSPLSTISKVEKPILFIHGDEDTFVPTYMTKMLHEKKEGYKEILIVKNDKHAQSFVGDTTSYINKVKQFLINIGIK